MVLGGRSGRTKFLSVVLIITLVLIGVCQWTAPAAGSESYGMQRSLERISSATIADNRNANRKTITVGENGTYQNIQYAIEDARPGDVIRVESGEYNKFVVRKRLIIKGVDTGNGKPVIDAGGQGPCVCIQADRAEIYNFKFTNSGDHEGGIKFVNANHTIVKNNTFETEDIGLNFHEGSTGNIFVLNDLSTPGGKFFLRRISNPKNKLNTTKRITYWFNGEKHTGRVGNYYGESRVDRNGDGIAESSFQTKNYPEKNIDHHPLVAPPSMYFTREVENGETKELSGRDTQRQETTSARSTELTSSSKTRTRRHTTTTLVESSQTNDMSATDETQIQTKRSRGFFTNSGDAPSILQNFFNLTVIGFVLSLVGLVHQLMGEGR